MNPEIMANLSENDKKMAGITPEKPNRKSKRDEIIGEDLRADMQAQVRNQLRKSVEGNLGYLTGKKKKGK